LARFLAIKRSCPKLREKAKGFLNEEGANIIFTSDNLILTKKPTLSKNKGLDLTKVTNEGETSIMLDVRCANSKDGKDTCKNEQTVKLIERFNQLGLISNQ
jgi:hypothetical protein